MGEVWFSFFSCVSFHASVLYTCFSIYMSYVITSKVAYEHMCISILLENEASPPSHTMCTNVLYNYLYIFLTIRYTYRHYTCDSFSTEHHTFPSHKHTHNKPTHNYVHTQIHVHTYVLTSPVTSPTYCTITTHVIHSPMTDTRSLPPHSLYGSVGDGVD